jgi:hypothetical protein
MRFHDSITQFLRELKRRKVFQVGSIYLVGAWGASLGAADLLPAFGVPEWGVRMFVIVAVLGFPVALALAWVYEMSTEGIRLDPMVEGALPRAPAATTRLAAGAANLTVTWEADGRTQHKSFANTFTLGRDPACEVYFDDDMVSRRHARLFVERGVWHVEDLGSRNGTRLNGEVVHRSAVENGAELVLYPGGPALRLEIRGGGRRVTRAVLERAPAELH